LQIFLTQEDNDRTPVKEPAKPQASEGKSIGDGST
jgi:hypothetical protein